MSYQVIARKYRPMTFDEIIGQDHVTSTLRNALATKRVAHAYLFSGTRGCGKTTTARILARALNCESPNAYNPDNSCATCKEILEGRSLDVIEIDGASNRGVDEIRNLRDSVRYTPTHGKYKVYIIDEVHMLTKEAFNALLKTLEEPPPHVVFVFATTEVHKVPMTILSRCQRFDFRRIPINEIVANLKLIAKTEQMSVEEEALQIIAKRADGSLRDAQSIFEQVRSFCGSTITAEELLNAFHVVDQDVYFQLTSALKGKNASAALEILHSVLSGGYDLREFVGGFLEHLRNLLVVRSTNSSAFLEVSETYRQRYENESKEFHDSDLLRYIKQTTDLEQALRWTTQPRYRLEAAILQMVEMENSVTIQKLLEEIDELKKKLDSKTQQPSFSRTDFSSSKSTNLFTMSPQTGGFNQSSKTVSSSFTHTKETETTYSSAVVHSLSMDEILTHWPAFIEEVAREKIALGISLKSARIVEVRNGVLKVACSEAFHFDSLKRNKEYLAQRIQRLLGKRVVIEPLHQEGEGIRMSAGEEGKPQGERKKNDVQHPILDILQRELGAERIE